MAKLTDLNDIRHRPDLPPMRNFELIPQAGRDIGQDIEIRKMLMAPVFRCDAVVTMGTPEMEPESTETTPKMMGIPLYTVGYIPTGSGKAEIIPSIVSDPEKPVDDGMVKRFMDDSLTRFGTRSVAYVR